MFWKAIYIVSVGAWNLDRKISSVEILEVFKRKLSVKQKMDFGVCLMTINSKNKEQYDWRKCCDLPVL